jgi:hypothetical protein
MLIWFAGAWTVTSPAAAASTNNLKLLKYLLDNGCEANGAVCYYATRQGYTDILEYVHEKNIPCEHNNAQVAASLKADPNQYFYFL